MSTLRRIGRWTAWIGRSRLLLSGAVVLAALAAACEHVDAKAVMRISDVETYWILDPSHSGKRFLAPAVRFRVTNISNQELISVDATAAFRRDGSPEAWGSGFFRLTEGRKTLKAGASSLVTMSSDARYSTEGEPANAFANSAFKPVNVTFFLKVGSSAWVEFGKASVENLIGSKEARAMLAPPPPPSK